MNQNEQHPTLELPFYVNGTLDAAEHKAVEAHLSDCEVCQAEVSFLQALGRQVKDNNHVNGPGELGWARLKKQIHAEKQTLRHSPSRFWQAVAAVALLAVAIQAGLLYRYTSVTDGYHMLGVADAHLQVAFYPQVTEQQMRDILNEVQVRIVDGPGALGIYRIELVGVPATQAAARRAVVRQKLSTYNKAVRHVSE